MKILGVDPGSRLAGVGCIELKGNRIQHIASGTLNLKVKGAEASMATRLRILYSELSTFIETHRPDALSVEKVFFAKNAQSALKLGQARGVVLLCAAHFGLEIFEYSPSEIKQAVSGSGKADKTQVARMVAILTGQRDFASADASDALAIAICHAHRANDPRIRAAANVDPAL